MTAFFWFCEKARPKIQEQRKAQGLEKLGLTQLSKELSKQWLVQPDYVKEKLQEIVEKDKARYQKELLAYKESEKLKKEENIKLESIKVEEETSAPSKLMIFDETMIIDDDDANEEEIKDDSNKNFFERA